MFFLSSISTATGIRAFYGRYTSVRRFNRIYSQFCDDENTQELPVLKCTDALHQFGCTVESRLMPVVLYMRLATKGKLNLLIPTRTYLVTL